MKEHTRLRATAWLFGTVLAIVQCWCFRHIVTADGIAYLDLSDAVFPNTNWNRLITGVWSPLYPFVLGLGRLLRPAPYKEIVTGHLLNVPIFLFAFVCFEFFLRSLVGPKCRPDSTSDDVSLPQWAYLTLGYALFLWASIDQITLKSLRPDMLMAGFVYLAMGVLLRIRHDGATWARFFVLGAILGVGFLAKELMLPIGMVILASSVLLAGNRRRALPMALVAGFLLLSIGSLYYIPLSKARGYFTLGESGGFNYLLHVNNASPSWYLQDVGTGKGKFRHSPVKIFDAPPTFEFSIGQTVTHPLRLDPSYWTEGARPRFRPSDQFWALVKNLKVYADVLSITGGLAVGFSVLWFISGSGPKALREVAGEWPLWLPGVAGLALYALVHVENRYVGVFFLLLWLGLLSGLRIPRNLSRQTASGVVLGIAVSLLLPMTFTLAAQFLQSTRGRGGEDAEAAMQLERLGIRAGDPVARISPTVMDLAWARMARVSIIAEVDFEHAADFWNSGQGTQDQVLQALAKTGAKVVVAHIMGNLAPPGWQRLGRTQYWVHGLSRA